MLRSESFRIGTDRHKQLEDSDPLKTYLRMKPVGPMPLKGDSASMVSAKLRQILFQHSIGLMFNSTTYPKALIDR